MVILPQQLRLNLSHIPFPFQSIRQYYAWKKFICKKRYFSFNALTFSFRRIWFDHRRVRQWLQTMIESFDQHHCRIFHLLVHFDYHSKSQLSSMLKASSLRKFPQQVVFLLTRQLGYENHLLKGQKQHWLVPKDIKKRKTLANDSVISFTLIGFAILKTRKIICLQRVEQVVQWLNYLQLD